MFGHILHEEEKRLANLTASARRRSITFPQDEEMVAYLLFRAPAQEPGLGTSSRGLRLRLHRLQLQLQLT
jgi:hypothetical protein